MKNVTIHPTAIVEPGATLGSGVIIESYAIVKSNVILGDGVHIMSHAYIEGNTTIGEGTVIYPFACIGTKTQDRKFRGEKTYVSIGKNCEIREYVTINSSCQEGSCVKVGDNCLIMAYCHVAHNCEVGNNVIMSNGATLAGHVIVEDNACIGGMTPIHQFARIGTYAFVGGMSRVTHDIPPYTIGAGIPFKFGGLNLVGLKRNGFPLEVRLSLTKAFKILFRGGLSMQEALDKMENEIASCPELDHFIQFCRSTKRGILGLQDSSYGEEDAEQLEKDAVLR